LIVALLGVIGLYISVRYGIEEMLYPAVLGFRNYNPATSTPYYILDNIYYASPAIVISGVVWSFEETLRRERENRQLRQEKTQAEEAFLRTQINPHFLYNTLNYFYSLAYPISEQLGSAVLKLSDLMRYMLHQRPDGQVELTREIDYLHNYIDLYRLRFGGQFFVEFTVTGEAAGQRLPALLLIPFAENVFKHGVLNCPDTPVYIQLTIKPNELLFEVDNKIGQHQKDATSGIGLANVRRRLELLYPNRHTLTVSQTSERFHTLLRLQEA
jgi:LytS/YehU family sensor histidine kinase